MRAHEVVSREVWLEQRRRLLAEEKALTDKRDAVARARRALPWVAVEKDYRFEGEGGEASLGDLFRARGQLIVFHFMFGPDWEAGCPSCSFWMDNFERIDVHLAHRDTSLVAISRAPYPKLAAYRERMGWTFDWVSSYGNDFNRDFHVSFTQAELDTDTAHYNYRDGSFPSEEAPGISVFARRGDGAVFHTYSCYARGLDGVNGAYQLLDLTPAGRDESDLEYTMAWLRRRDEYDAAE